jgi:hypothetical protein
MNAFAIEDGPKGHGLGTRGDCHRSRSTRWLSRPLCRSYAFAYFSTFATPFERGASNGSTCWCWALGMLADGQCEILGAWDGEATALATKIAKELNVRGIERIGAIATANTSGIAVDYSALVQCRLATKEIKPGDSQESAPRESVSARERRAFGQAIAVTSSVQSHLDRAMRRCALRSNDSEAVPVIARALQHADRRIVNAAHKGGLYGSECVAAMGGEPTQQRAA